MNKQAIDWKIIFAIYTYIYIYVPNNFVSRMCKTISQLKYKNTNNPM